MSAKLILTDSLFVLFVLLVIALFYLQYRNRKHFISNLTKRQTVRYGQGDRIGRIIALDKYTAEIFDLTDGKRRTVYYYQIRPL